MEVTITQFRQKIFDFVNHAMEGRAVWVTHKGRRFKIEPEDKGGSRLSRITSLEVINPAFADLADIKDSSVQEEMEQAWERDWGGSVIAYLDTNVVVWLAQNKLSRISSKARDLLEEADLLLSPVVLLELEYLHEVNRIRLTSRDVQLKIEHELDVRICDLSFAAVMRAATAEKWTRDPFDRMIVAHAKSNVLAFLITSDEEMREHYFRAVW